MVISGFTKIQKEAEKNKFHKHSAGLRDRANLQNRMHDITNYVSLKAHA